VAACARDCGTVSSPADPGEIHAAKLRGEQVEAVTVEAEWSGILRIVRAGMLAVPSRVAARLPHLSRTDVAEIDVEVRAAPTEIGSAG
jgi:phage terminase Nu1 subunit (DNA packaging protein)